MDGPLYYVVMIVLLIALIGFFLWYRKHQA
jgi:LPXTG-motif cell wall-anchored protein